jgi:CBS domain-containing protein
MASSGLDAVLVADGGKLLGIVTASDIVRSIAAANSGNQASLP